MNHVRGDILDRNEAVDTEFGEGLAEDGPGGGVTIPLSTTSLGDAELTYVRDALQSGLISSIGPYVSRFEAEISRSVGVDHAVATASGTSALELILRALNVGPGDEVIVPAFTFAAPALAVALVGARPVFADVSAETWTIDPADVWRLKTPKTRAVIAVNVLGHPCDFDALAAVGLPVIEDAAEAHGATYKGRAVGSCGLASIFSFHASKTATTGEGGCVTTNDAQLADRIRRLNSFGMDPDRRYWHTEIGGNYRMTNLVAALGLAQVQRWGELVAARKATAARYDALLKGMPFERRPVAAWAGEAVWLYSVATDRRDAALHACQARGVDARAAWPSLPDNPGFAQFGPADCPQARRIAARVLLLPTWGGMPDRMVKRVAAALAAAGP